MITVAVVDAHPAVRAGLDALLNSEPGFTCVASLATAQALAQVVERERPAVLMLDPAVDGGQGLVACFKIKRHPAAPGVLLYTTWSDGAFAVPAAIARADEIAPKSVPASDLLAAIRRAAAGAPRRPELPEDLVEAAFARLDVTDLPMARLLAGTTPVADVAAALRVALSDVEDAAVRILARMASGIRT